MSQLLHLICDYGPNDQAWAEIVSSLHDEGVNATIWPTTANSFDTISTGFTLAQLACKKFKKPENVFVFANCAPRKDAARARKNNEGEGLLYIKLKNGVRVLAVNSGYSLSFLRPYIAEIWSTVTQSSGSQFRSRDFFPIAIAQLMRGDMSFLRTQLVVDDVVDDYPHGVVGYVDSFGNIKTTHRTGDKNLTSMKPGQILKVKIGRVTQFATFSGGSFGVRDGELAFAPGSSGYDRPFYELFKRGASAFEAFGRPAPGSPISVTKVKEPSTARRTASRAKKS